MKNNTRLIMETWRRFINEESEGEVTDGDVPQDNEAPFDSSVPVEEDPDFTSSDEYLDDRPHHDRYLDDAPEGYYDPDEEYSDADSAYGKDGYKYLDTEYDEDYEPPYMNDKPELDKEMDPEELARLSARKDKDLGSRNDEDEFYDPEEAREQYLNIDDDFEPEF